MQLSLKILDNYAGPNSYQESGWLGLTEGSYPVTLVFKLVDNTNSGRLYIAPTGSTLTVQTDNLNDSTKLTKTASLVTGTPFWQITFAQGDLKGGTMNLKITLNDTIGGKIITGYAPAALRIWSANNLPLPNGM